MTVLNDRLGSEATDLRRSRHVRFSPNSDRMAPSQQPMLRATSRHGAFHFRSYQYCYLGFSSLSLGVINGD